MSAPLFIPDAIEELPHWARIAFAARCARHVLGLFREAWPDAGPERLAALELAVELAEQSAAAGSPALGIEDAAAHATMAAGAALAKFVGRPEYPGPENEDKSHIATFAAKSADRAGEAAQQPADMSGNVALQAYIYARDAASRARAVRILVELDDDFETVYHRAKHEGWRHGTAVAQSAFHK